MGEVKTLEHALKCAVAQKKICKRFSLKAESATWTAEDKAEALNAARYFRRCAHNLRIVLAAHRGRCKHGIGNLPGIQSWNMRRRKAARLAKRRAERLRSPFRSPQLNVALHNLEEGRSLLGGSV
jgi:hypothetical protein